MEHSYEWSLQVVDKASGHASSHSDFAIPQTKLAGARRDNFS
jgi:hypothetical protein